MPGDRLPFAVFIGCEPDLLGGLNGSLKLGDDFLFFGVNFVLSFKPVLDVYRRRSLFGFLYDTANVAHAREDMKIFTEVFLDSLCLGWALYNY